MLLMTCTAAQATLRGTTARSEAEPSQARQALLEPRIELMPQRFFLLQVALVGVVVGLLLAAPGLAVTQLARRTRYGGGAVRYRDEWLRSSGGQPPPTRGSRTTDLSSL